MKNCPHFSSQTARITGNNPDLQDRRADEILTNTTKNVQFPMIEHFFMLFMQVILTENTNFAGNKEKEWRRRILLR